MKRFRRRKTEDRSQKSALVLLLAASGLTALTVNARVFEKHSSGLLSSDAYASLGWQQVYDAPMNIDGQDAEVQMWQSSEYPDQVAATLEAHCLNRGIPSGFFMGKRMGWGLSVADGNLIKHLIFSPDGNRNTFVLHIRTAEGSERSRPEDPWLMPGAQPTRSLANSQAGLRLLQSESSDSEQQVRQFYRDRFTADGWSLHLAGRQQVPSGSDIYLKKGRLGVLIVNSTGQDPLTRITMMQQSTGDRLP
jgi:hypothetical protein